MKNGIKYKPWNGKVGIKIVHCINAKGVSTVGVYALTKCNTSSKALHTQPLAYITAKLSWFKVLNVGKGNHNQ